MNIRKRSRKVLESLSDLEKQVFNILKKDRSIHIDEICKETKLSISKISSALGLLELKYLAEREAGMRFKKK